MNSTSVYVFTLVNGLFLEKGNAKQILKLFQLCEQSLQHVVKVTIQSRLIKKSIYDSSYHSVSEPLKILCDNLLVIF